MHGDCGYALLQQAHDLDMLKAGFAWVVTEGITSYNTPDTDSHIFEGLIGTTPCTEHGNLAVELFGTTDPGVCSAYSVYLI